MRDPREDVAIVGMAAVFPGAPDLDTYWRNIEAGVDAIADVPPSRWDPVYFDPTATAVDRFYCRRGGFVEPTFDPLAFGIMPVAVNGAEPDQLLALQVAARALDDAGCAVPRDRTGVVIGRGGYLTPAMGRLVDRVRTAQQVVTTIAELLPDVDAATLDRIRAALQSKTSELGPEAAIGLVPNLAASRIANRLDLRGPAYTVDAACASSLIAVDHACRELADRRCDLMIAGGVHVCHDVTFWSVFTQLGALSRAQKIRPFDRRADGILIGEGAGLVVLERLADAERAGHRIYAVIRGTGVSSDGRESSPMRPRLDGQLAALDRAWGGLERSLGLVEAHGTGTPTGDEVELTALGDFFGGTAGERAVLGSVKSMIGHAMPAAGAAGLIKAALAIHHGVLPPSLHCEEPHDALARTRFRVLGAAEPWGDLPRRAGVSAFGFGGINAHVVIDGHAPARPRARTHAGGPELLAIAADSIDGLRAALDRGGSTTGRMRFAMLDPTPERRTMALKVLDRGKGWRGNHDIWFAPEPIGGKLAFVFPGVEVAFAPDLGDLPRRLGLSAPAAIDTAIAADDTDVERRGAGVFALGRYLASVLGKLRVRPDLMIGHSLGEWTGMVASEMIPPGAIEAFLAALPADLEVPDVVFAAVGCGAAGAAAALEGLDQIAVSHDNCPHQSIVCGKRDRVRTVIERLGARGVMCQELPFRSGFHSPLFEAFLAPHRARIAELALQKPVVPLWSATMCAPYPDEPAGIRALAVDHLVKPVRFRELVEQLYAADVRTFVQLGVGSALGFVGDTLRGKDHLAVAAISHQHPGQAQLARVRAALWSAGFDVELAEKPAARSQVKLDLGAPLVRIAGMVPALRAAPALPDPAGDPVLAEAVAALREISDATHAIVDAWRKRMTPVQPRERTSRRTMSVEAEPALLDHCFYRQPGGWAAVSDRFPVVPMTMMIAMMIDAARAHAPGRVAVEVTDVLAQRWLAVAPPVEIELRTAQIDGDRVDVEIVGYARATVRLADQYPAAPAPALAPLVNPRATPVTAHEMYEGRWMFHGPRYAGVAAMGPMGDDGVDGVIETLPAPGALLDCAGQLMGWWVMNHERVDRLAMPLRIDRIALYGPDPAPPARVDCRVRIRDLKERDVRADLELVVDGRLWCKIDSWEDRRFDSDDAVWAVLMYPEHNALASSRGPFVDVTEHWRGASSRELMMRRYLGAVEREHYEQIGARRRRGWLLGRIAIKDAVRMHAWQHGTAQMFPVEVEVANEANGRPFVRGSMLGVSVAHKDDRAVAMVAADRDVGIDLERIEPRPDTFANVAFTPAELALGAGQPRDEWMARLWAAKEALGKARGTGVTDPKRLEIRAAHGDRLEIDGVVVETVRDGDHVIAWTSLPRSVLV